MLHIRFADLLEAMRRDQFYDPLKVGPDIDRESVERGFNLLVEEDDNPGRIQIIPFLRYSATHSNLLENLMLGASVYHFAYFPLL